MSVLKDLYNHKSGRVTASNQLSTSFVASSGVQKDYPISPFPFHLVMEDDLQNALFGLLDGGVEVVLRKRF